MTSHGLDKPWWLAETNAPVTDDPSWPVESVTLSVLQPEQAAYMPQALAVALAVGIDRIAVYKLIDTPSDRAANPEPFGLLRMDGSKRPAFETYRVAIEQLDGVWGGQRERWNEVGQIRLDGNGRSTTVVFSRLPAAQEAMVLASAETAQLITQTGEASTIKPVNGFFQIPLPPAICSQSIGDYCMIGGQTFYVVQASPRQQPATPTATAIATAIPTESAEAAATQPASTHTPSPTQAPPATATPIPTATQAPSTAPQPASAFNFSYLILLGAGLLAAVGIYLAKKR